MIHNITNTSIITTFANFTNITNSVISPKTNDAFFGLYFLKKDYIAMTTILTVLIILYTFMFNNIVQFVFDDGRYYRHDRREILNAGFLLIFSPLLGFLGTLLTDILEYIFMNFGLYGIICVKYLIYACIAGFFSYNILYFFPKELLAWYYVKYKYNVAKKDEYTEDNV